MGLSRSISALLPIVTCAIFARVAAGLSFDRPRFNDVSGNGWPYFMRGSDVNIAWTSEFAETTLIVFQNVTGEIVFEPLAVANGPNNNTFTWTAAAVRGNPISFSQFHFFLQNSNNFNCDGCFVNSQIFQLLADAPAPASSASITRVSTSPPMTSNIAASASASASAAAAGANAGTSESEDDSSDSSGSGLGIELGIGLGVGIPVLIVLATFFFLAARRRKQQRKTSESAKAFAHDSSPSSGSEYAKKEKSDDRFSRESGALGVWGASPSPNGYRKDPAELEAQPNGEWVPPPRNPERLSQRHLPALSQPGMATYEEVSDEGIRESYIDQFEFEQPGHRDADEMSQVRKSISEAPSLYARSTYSRASGIEDVPNLPDSEVPQLPSPVHHGPDDNWPLRY